jgi:zinc protease
MPRWDSNPVLRAQAAAKINYESYAASPQGVLERDLKLLERGGDPVFRTPTPADIDATTVAGFRAVWEPILRQGPIEVQLFGDFDKAKAMEALNRTFGALPDRGSLPAGTAGLDVRALPASTRPVLIYHRGQDNQAAGMIGWPTSGGTAQTRESRQLEILSQLFQNRLLDKLREKLGEAYAPQVVNSWPVDLNNGGSILAMATLQPKSVPIFFATAEEIASDLAANPVSAEELGRVTEPLKQSLSRASSSSAFFMYLIEGASHDPARYGKVRSVMGDYTQTTPEAMQALARKYLSPGKSWRVAVIPQGQELAGQELAGQGTAPSAKTPANGR